MDGNLTVTVVDAKDLNKEDHLTRNDPYCYIRIGSILKGTRQKFQTKTINGGGNNVTWNETHTFKMSGLKSDSNLRVAVYDKDFIKDDYIGLVKIPLSELFANQSKGKHYYQLTEKGHDRRIAGYIGIIAKFDGAGVVDTSAAATGVTSTTGTGVDTKQHGSVMDKVKDKLSGHHTHTTHDTVGGHHTTTTAQDTTAQDTTGQYAAPAQVPIQGTPLQGAPYGTSQTTGQYPIT
jgi:hypothetical protein